MGIGGNFGGVQSSRSRLRREAARHETGDEGENRQHALNERRPSKGKQMKLAVDRRRDVELTE